MIPFSILDLSPVAMGSNPAQSLRNTLDLAQHAEQWGYHRYWLAEHHSMPGIASAATSVVICHVASGTSSIRVGRGRHHAAESFAAGDRRAIRHLGEPVSGPHRSWAWAVLRGPIRLTAQALRRNLTSDPEHFPRDVLELMGYFAPPTGEQRVMAIPGAGLKVPLWILGSSLFGAQVAAAFGSTLRLRVALRAGHDDAGLGSLPRAIPTVRTARPPLCHAGIQYFCCRVRLTKRACWPPPCNRLS